MTARIAVLTLVLLALVGCGIKNDLEPPQGAEQRKGEADPSKPTTPNTPLGQ